MQTRFLVISDSDQDMTWLREALSALGTLEVMPEERVRSCCILQNYTLIVIDTTTTSDYLTLITDIRRQEPEARMVVATASPSWSVAREAFRAGAMDYINHAMSPHELLAVCVAILTQPATPLTSILQRQREASMRTPTILFAENDVPFLEARQELLLQEGYQVLAATNATMARQALMQESIDLAIIDIRLDNDNDEHDLSGLLLAREVAPEVPKIILTGFPSVDYARKAYSPYLTGTPVVDIFSKHEPVDLLLRAVRTVLSRPTIVLIHGRDEAAQAIVRDFLAKGGLRVVRLHDQSMGGKTIIEKLEYYAEDIDLAVVLLTPDDIGGAMQQDVHPRARQNMLFELGYFIGKLGRPKVIPLYNEGVEIPSDLAGLFPILLDAHNGWKLPLAQEIHHAGMAFDLVKAAL